MHGCECTTHGCMRLTWEEAEAEVEVEVPLDARTWMCLVISTIN
jgi:hypothetical protein